MLRYAFIVSIIPFFAIVQDSIGCPDVGKYYVACDSSITLSQAVSTCRQYGMTLLTLSNTTDLQSNIAELNRTLFSSNCTSYFWFSSNNRTGYVGNVSSLADIITAVLEGVLNLVGGVLGFIGDLLGCLLLFGCPTATTTTPRPITSAVMICTRQPQQRVIRKCSTLAQKDMRSFNFIEKPMYGGVLYTFEARSPSACSARCSADARCLGISFINNNCTLYM